MRPSSVRALTHQKNRAIDTLMKAKDKVDPDLAPADSRALRNTMLDAVNDMFRNMLLIIEADEEGLDVNELFIDRLSRSG